MFISILISSYIVTVYGKTEILIGQNYQAEFESYVSAVGQPAGASFYTTFKTPSAFQGDGAAFVEYVNSKYPGSYAELGLSLKESYTQNQCNIIYNYLGEIANGQYDSQISELASVIKKYSNLKWLIRVGYEVSEFIFSYKNPTGCQNGYQPSDIDNTNYHNAYNHIVSKMKAAGVSNAYNQYVYHPVRGTSDTEGLYPGDTNVDHIGFSIFNNDVCLPVGSTTNCPGQQIDPNLKASIEWAQGKNQQVMICESAVQNPASTAPNTFDDYLNRVYNVVRVYNLWAWTYINQNWCNHGWSCPPWGDSRVQDSPITLAYWKNITRLLSMNK
eukprot:90310_1